jgi:hypothetical protein
MRGFIVVFGAVVTAAALTTDITGILLHSEKPTMTRDHWECATESLMQYFAVPQPTGELRNALFSYGSSLLATCTATDYSARAACPHPDRTKWCEFSTAVPGSLLHEYSKYGSNASSWMAAHTSTALDLATYCPVGWYRAMWDTPAGRDWFNTTLNMAYCHHQAKQRNSTTTSLSTTSFSITSFSTTSSTAAIPSITSSTPEVTSAVKSNGAQKTTKGEKWVVVGIGLAAVALTRVTN